MSREMQRVRIGLTGLAFVFLLVLLATVFTRASNEEPITANRIDEIANGAAAPDIAGEPNEPLAELGVTPGTSDANQTNLQDARPVEDPLRAQRH